MDAGMFKYLGTVMITLFIGFCIGIILLIGIVCYTLFHKTVIKSEIKIQPKIELVIKDNKVDTLYIYEKPKT